MPVYEYKGQNFDLPEGLSNEQALSKIRTYLKEDTISTEQPAASQTAAEPSIASELGRQLGLTARAGISGLSSVPNAVADFLSGAANLGLMAAGSEQRVPYLSQVQQQALNQILPTPASGLESAVQTGAEAVAGLMTPGMRLPMAQQAEGATARQVATRAGAEALGTAAGAMVGEQAAKQVQEITGSPWAALAAGLATGTLVGSGTGKAAFALAGPRQEPVTIQQIRQRAQQGYQTMEDAGVTVKSNSIKNKLVPSIQDTLTKENFDPELVAAHKPIQDNLKLLNKIVSDPQVDFKRLEKLRGSFSSLSQGSDDTSRLAKVVVNEIDSFLANLSGKDIQSAKGDPKAALESLTKARTDWRNQSRAQVLQDILDSASAVVEGKGGAISDVLRNKMVNLTSNVDKMKLFSTAEQNVIKAATKATDLEGFLNVLSKFNPQRGLAQASIATSGIPMAATGTGPTQMAGLGMTTLSGLGYMSDKALAASRRKEVQDLISQIASGNLQAPKEGFAIPGLFGATLGTTGQ
jgi:hypothetical protein